MEIQDLILIFWLNFSAIFNQDPSSLPQRGSEIHINVLNYYGWSSCSASAGIGTN